VHIMGEREAVISSVLVSMLLLGSMSYVVFASSGNWVEVKRFTQENNNYPTELFSIDYFEWRIRLEVVPNIITHYFFGDLLTFSITIHPKGDMNYITLISWEHGNWSTPKGNWIDFSNGTSVWYNTNNLVVQDNIREYYLNITSEVVDRYLVIVEQNIDSIPEFPSWTFLPIFLTVTLIGILVRTKIRKKGLE